MAFQDFPDQEQGVQLLQRSLQRGRLAHAYLFTGHQLDELEALARTLAKTLNCSQPVRAGNGGVGIDSCDGCLSCRKIEQANHADVHWVRPESKSRVIVVEQMRELMHGQAAGADLRDRFTLQCRNNGYLSRLATYEVAAGPTFYVGGGKTDWTLTLRLDWRNLPF